MIVVIDKDKRFSKKLHETLGYVVYIETVHDALAFIARHWTHCQLHLGKAIDELWISSNVEGDIKLVSRFIRELSDTGRSFYIKEILVHEDDEMTAKMLARDLRGCGKGFLMTPFPPNEDVPAVTLESVMNTLLANACVADVLGDGWNMHRIDVCCVAFEVEARSLGTPGNFEVRSIKPHKGNLEMCEACHE